ncbi:MAG: fibronectin type III domain-containing protein [Candidatus Staskawiczbacteria bacterium]|nr:fibronectin type III domain-containing protein [Candidatus Staskawiczbacteria bacterium]
MPFNVSASENLAYIVPNLDSSLKSWWKMNDVSGTSVVDSMGSNTGISARDTSLMSMLGHMGGALNFNGTSDYVEMADSASLRSPTTEITMSAWVKVNSIGNDQYIIQKDYGPASYWQSWDSGITANGRFFFSVSNGTNEGGCGTPGNRYSYWYSVPTLSAGQWYHVVGKWKYTGAGATDGKIYINGTEVSTTILFYGGNEVTDIRYCGHGGNVWLGMYKVDGTPRYRLNGSLDDVMVFNRALTAGDIAALYNGQDINYNTTLLTGNYTYSVYASDLAGNVATSSTSNFTVDSTAPTISSVFTNAVSGSYGVGATIPINVNFSESVTSTGNVTVNLNTGRSCTFTISNASSGGCTYTVQAGDNTSGLAVSSVSGTIKDQVTNSMVTPATPVSNLPAGIVIDNTAPTVAITSPLTSTRVNASKVITFTDSETVAPKCSVDNINWTNCTSGTTTVGNISQFAGLTEDSTFTLYLKDTDLANNVGTTSVGSITKDTTSPSISFTDGVEIGPVSSDTIVADWGGAFVTKWKYNTGTTCSTVSADYPNFGPAIATQATATNNGKYICLYAADAAGNYVTWVSSNTINIDATSPTVTINQAAGQADPTSASPINFTAVFSESVSDFATGDVTLSGTAGATTATVTGSGTTYNVAVSGATGLGTVIANIAAGVAHDIGGNPSVVATYTDNTVTIGNPTPTTTSLSPSTTFAGAAGFTLTVNGTNFVSGAVVNFNGSAKTTTYVSSTQLTATIPATDVATVGSYNVTVTNPAPGGGTSNAQTFAVTAAAVPGVPTGVTATVSNTQVTLAWTAPGSTGGSPITGYNIYRSTTPGGEGTTVYATSSASPYINIGLTRGTTYYYQVATVNRVGVGTFSGEVSAVISATAPGAPTITSATASAIGNGTQIVLNWTAGPTGGSPITSYKVYRSTTFGGGDLLISGGCSSLGNVLTCTDATVTTGTAYYYKIKAHNAIDDSIFSNEIHIAASLAPTAPTAISALAGNNQIILTWTAPGGSTVSFYKIYRSTASNGQGNTAVATIGNALTSYTDINVPSINTATYYYKVTAVNGAGESDKSNEVSDSAPFIMQITPVPSPTGDTTPDYTFSSTKAGAITYQGSCSSATTSAVAGNNTITFNTLASNATYSNCKLKVTANSNLLSVDPFTINTTAPTTFATATAGGNAYTFGNWTNQSSVAVTLCDGAGPTCAPTPYLSYYCIDTNNSCTPTIIYNSTNKPTISNQGLTYIRFYSKDDAGNSNAISNYSATIKIDTTAPVVNAGPDIQTNSSYTSLATASDTGSGIDSYSWSKVSGLGTITFGSATSANTTILASTSGAYSLRLTVTDNVGNFAYDDFNLVWGAPNPTFETSVSVSSVRIPERALMVPWSATTDFKIGNAIITARDKDGVLKNSMAFSSGWMQNGSAVTFSFTYSADKAPYHIYAEVPVTAQGANIICKADCTPVAANSGWYYIPSSAINPTVLSAGGSYPTCSTNNSTCTATGDLRNGIAVNSANVVSGNWRILLQTIK